MYVESNNPHKSNSYGPEVIAQNESVFNLPMEIRDRIKEFRRVRSTELTPHPGNWRVHNDAQRAALQEVLREIGWADAILARELPDGTLQICDGHLRTSISDDQEVPVLILDLDDHEAKKLLLSLDPLAGMAEADPGRLQALLDEVVPEGEALAALLSRLAEDAGLLDKQSELADAGDEVEVPESFQLIVECDSEAHQQRLFNEMTAKGHKCRVLTL